MTSRDDVWTSDSSAYLRPRGEADAWAAEAAAKGGVGSQQLLGVQTTQPPIDVRLALNLGPHDLAVLRQRLIEFDGHPVEITNSWYPGGIAVGTGLAETKKIRGGAVTLLAEMGHRIEHATEDVESRLATPDELDLLRMESGQPVLVLSRLSEDQDGQPVEMSVMVMPGKRRRLRYEMKVN